MPSNSPSYIYYSKTKSSAYGLSFGLSVLFLVLILLSVYFNASQLNICLLSLAACFFSGGLILRGALADIKRFVFTERVFIVISILGALGYGLIHLVFPVKKFGGVDGLFLEVVILLCVINWVKIAELRGFERRHKFIKKIDNFVPKSARLMQDKKERRVFASEIERGSVLLIRKGEMIPADGVITRGVTEIDESLITGNTLPAAKSVGGQVYAGTLNLAEDIYIEASCAAAETKLMDVINALKNSETSKIRVSAPPFFFLRVVFPAVFVFICAVVFCLFRGGGYEQPLYYFTMLLFFLFFITPAGLVINKGVAGACLKKGVKRKNILISGVDALQAFKESDIVFFDKTGTLTKGKLKVNKVTPAAKDKRDALLSAFVTAEKELSSFFAAALKEYTRNKDIKTEAVTSVELEPGKGVKAKAASGVIIAGNARFLSAHKIQVTEAKDACAQDSVVYVAKNREFLGSVTFSDDVRDGVSEVVGELKEKGKEIVLVSGDNEQAVACVAAVAGIEKWQASLLPADKEKIVEEELSKGKTASMVGDGFNDILALLKVDCSMAFYRGETSQVNWVDVLIKNKNIRSLTCLLRGFRRYSLNRIENIILAALFNILFLMYLYFYKGDSPWYLCGAAVLVNMLAVFLNSARLMVIKL